MKKIFTLFLIFYTISSGAEESFNFQFLDTHAFVLPKDRAQIKLGYLRMNDAIDILNIKEKEIGNLESKYGSIGDMTGIEIEGRYGLTNRDSLFLNIEQWSVAYSSSKLKNHHFEFFERHLLRENGYSFFNTIVADAGIIYDKADDLHIKNDNLINKMIQKIKPGSKIKIKDGTIVYNDLTLTFYDKNGNKIYPHIVTTNMSHKAIFARVGIGKRFGYKALLSFYTGVRRSRATSKVEPAPKGKNSFLDKQFEKVHTVNFDRYETMADFGISYALVLSRKWLGEINYEFDKFFRGDELSYMDTNHILNASLTRAINRKVSIFAGGKIMLHQFNTDLPYLYNKYTKTQFDKKYGFINVGLIYSF